MKNQLTQKVGWIRGNTKIGPVSEVTTSYLQGKYGVAIRIEPVNKDNSQSWVRISHGLSMLVKDLSNKEDEDNEQETSETKSDEFALKTNVLALKEDQRVKQNHEDLTRQDTKIFISELFKVIQDAIPLILNYRTMFLFLTISSSTCTILDVQSIYTLSQIQG